MNDNPLKQYFRRPSIYIKLPSGGQSYSTDVIDMPNGGEIPIYPMTAIDEITARTPDALFNGHAVAEIISSCVPCIKDPWQINNIDLDAIIMAIRVATSGEDMDIMSTCPKCNNEGKFGINLVKLLAEQKNIDYNKTLKVRDLEIKFKPLTYTDKNKTNLAQYEIQKMLVMLEDMDDPEEKKKLTSNAMKRLNDIMSETYTSTIEYIKTPETVVDNKEYIKEFLDNCDKNTSNAIKEFSTTLNEQNKLKPLHIRCTACSNEYEQPLVLNVTDFFV